MGTRDDVGVMPIAVSLPAPKTSRLEGLESRPEDDKRSQMPTEALGEAEKARTEAEAGSIAAQARTLADRVLCPRGLA
jgi:hypothetical protein